MQLALCCRYQLSEHEIYRCAPEQAHLSNAQVMHGQKGHSGHKGPSSLRHLESLGVEHVRSEKVELVKDGLGFIRCKVVVC